MKKHATMYGVYQHAEWRITDHATSAGYVRETGLGLVVSEVSFVVPYNRMTPVRVFKSRSAAQKFVDRS